MKKLINLIIALKNTELKDKIDERLSVFESYKSRSTEEWFSELCFCILTANSKMMTAKAIQDELGINGFMTKKETELSDCIKKNKHRFHNTKAKYIVNARKYANIKNLLNKTENEKEKRNWLVKNVKGIGYKEASHFLRNTGCKNLAIVDRHIQNILIEHNVLDEKPKAINKTAYLDIEEKLRIISEKLNMSQAELDLYLFNIETGKVYK